MTRALRIFSAAFLLAASGAAAAQAAPVTLNPIADAYVLDGSWAGSNFGTGTLLHTQTASNSNYDSYLKFDTSSIASIASARLRVSASLTGSSAIGMAVYPVSDTAWSETAITWNNKPARGASLGSAAVSGSTYVYYEVDVSNYVLAEKAAGRAIVSLALHNTQTSSQRIYIRSRENTNGPPQLVIVPNAAPTVSLTAPANNALFVAPASVTLSASAADADGTVAKVEFFDGAVLVASVTVAPFSTTLANLAPGTHTLSARATDNLGLGATSAAVTIRVDTSPTVNLIAPAHNSVFTAPASITLTANAADADGSVAKVEFFDGAILVGTATAAPYSVTLANVALGAHSYTARATDDLGIVTTSVAVSVTVNAAPTVSITAPVNNALFTAPASISVTASAADSDGTVTKVEFFNGAAKLGEDTTAPYSFTWSGVAAGTYTVTARASDNLGDTARRVSPLPSS